MSDLRKVIHIATAAVPLAGWLISFRWALGLAAAMLAASLAVEAGRRLWPYLNLRLWALLPGLFRESETREVLGSTWLGVGMLATLLAFGRDAGGTAALFVAWGDSAAEIAGRRWGRRGKRKSIAGSLACFAACVGAAWLASALGVLSPAPALAGAVIATLVERWSPPPDDNVWMPLLSGLAIAAVAWLCTRAV